MVNKFNPKTLNKLLTIILASLIACIVIIMIVSVSFTYLAADDFSWLCGMRDMFEEYGDNHLSASLRGAHAYYKHNEGSFFANFLVYFLNPYERFGLQGFHLVMTCILFLFVISLFVLIQKIIREKNLTLLLGLLLLLFTFCTYCSNGVQELFLWFTGACYYTIELSLSFISIALLIDILKADKLKLSKVIISSIAAFLASGGNLILSAFNCSCILLVLAMCCKKDFKKLYIYIPFVSAVISALINVISPGNFVRADSNLIEGHSTVADALRDNVYLIFSEAKAVLKSETLVIGLLIVLLVFALNKSLFSDIKISTKHLVLAWVSGYVVIYLSMFPVALGTHSSELSSMRLHQIFLMILSMCLTFALAVTGLWIKNISSNKLKYPVLGTLTILFFVLFLANPNHTDMKEGFTGCVITDMTNTNLRKNYITKSHVLSTLELAEEGSDVILFLPYYPCGSAYGMGITENPDSFVNNTVENWKRVKSVTVYYIGLTYPAE